EPGEQRLGVLSWQERRELVELRLDVVEHLAPARREPVGEINRESFHRAVPPVGRPILSGSAESLGELWRSGGVGVSAPWLARRATPPIRCCCAYGQSK